MMDMNSMPETGAEEAGEDMPEEQEREICVHVLGDGSLDVDGEPAADLAACLKLVMAKVKALQAESGGDEQAAFEQGYKSVRNGAV